MNTNNSDIDKILEAYKKITIIGLSPEPSKPSYKVALHMKSNGYEIVSVRPGGDKTVAGCINYSKLQDVPKEFRKFVNVFRAPEYIPKLVEDVLLLKDVEVLWLQLGITSRDAEKMAEAAGLKVVSDRCLLIEYERSHKS